MEINFYNLFGIDFNAPVSTLRESFKRISESYHPDVNRSKSARDFFNLAFEAYEILVDRVLRKDYNALLQAPLIRNSVSVGNLMLQEATRSNREFLYMFFAGNGSFIIPPPPREFTISKYKTNMDVSLTPWRCTQGRAKLYEIVARDETTAEAVDVAARNCGCFADEVEVPTDAKSAGDPPLEKEEPIYETVLLTLYEIELGCLRQLRIARVVYHNGGRSIHVKEYDLKIPIGIKNGTKVVFIGEGNQTENKLPGDIVVTFRAMSHPWYKRDGDDIKYIVRYRMKKHKSSVVVAVPTLWGGTILYRVPEDVEKRSCVTVISDFGLPTVMDHKVRGNMLITYKIEK